MEAKNILHIANIAMIDFSEEELAGFEKNFNETMQLIDEIKEIDTNGEITFQVNDTVNNLRKDEVKESLSQEDAVSNAKEEKYGYFNIVKFVD